MTVSAALLAVAIMLLAGAVFVGLRGLCRGLEALGQSVSGFWSGQGQETAYVDLEALLAEREVADPVFPIGGDMVLESELDPQGS